MGLREFTLLKEKVDQKREETNASLVFFVLQRELIGASNIYVSNKNSLKNHKWNSLSSLFYNLESR